MSVLYEIKAHNDVLVVAYEEHTDFIVCPICLDMPDRTVVQPLRWLDDDTIAEFARLVAEQLGEDVPASCIYLEVCEHCFTQPIVGWVIYRDERGEVETAFPLHKGDPIPDDKEVWEHPPSGGRFWYAGPELTYWSRE